MSLLITLGVIGGAALLAALYLLGLQIAIAVTAHTKMFKAKVDAIIAKHDAKRLAKKEAKEKVKEIKQETEAEEITAEVESVIEEITDTTATETAETEITEQE